MSQWDRRRIKPVHNLTGIRIIVVLLLINIVWLFFGIIELTRKPQMYPAVIAPIVFSIFIGTLLYFTRHRIYAKRVELTPEGILVSTWKKAEVIPIDQVSSIIHQESFDGAYCWLRFTDGRYIVFTDPLAANALLEAISGATGLPFVHKKARMGT